MRKTNLFLLGVAVCSASLQLSGAQSNPPPVPAQSSPAAEHSQAPEHTQAPEHAPSQSSPGEPASVAPSETVPPSSSSLPAPAAKSGAKGSGRTASKGNTGRGSTGVNPLREDGKPFVIGSEDVLGIRVWDEPNLSGQVTVGPDGMISLQLIHEVKASGLTTVQLEARLTERLKTIINNPEVSVQVLGVRSRRYSLQGAVGRTGTFPLTGPTTILEALVNGGGFKEFAKTKQIYILRMKPDGTPEKINFNYKEVSHGKHMEQNILIQNGDFIIVPE